MGQCVSQNTEEKQSSKELKSWIESEIKAHDVSCPLLDHIYGNTENSDRKLSSSSLNHLMMMNMQGDDMVQKLVRILCTHQGCISKSRFWENRRTNS